MSKLCKVTISLPECLPVYNHPKFERLYISIYEAIYNFGLNPIFVPNAPWRGMKTTLAPLIFH